MIGKLIVFGAIVCVILWAIKLLNKAGKPPKNGGGKNDKDTVNLKQDKDGTFRPDDDDD